MTPQQEYPRQVSEYLLAARARRNLLIMKKSWGCKDIVIPPLPVRPALTQDQIEINKITDVLRRAVIVQGRNYDPNELRARAEAMYREAHL